MAKGKLPIGMRFFLYRRAGCALRFQRKLDELSLAYAITIHKVRDRNSPLWSCLWRCSKKANGHTGGAGAWHKKRQVTEERTVY